MVQYHKTSKTKASGSGGKRKTSKDKSLVNYGGFFSRSRLEKNKDASYKTRKTKGGSTKIAVSRAVFANIVVAGKTKQVKIINVKNNPANRDYARENIMTKGALIETEAGMARVTSRPGQHGIINAILVKK